MKWLAFGTALAGVYPLAIWLRRDPRAERWAWTTLGMLLFIQPGLNFLKIGIISWPWFPGWTHGFEVTLIDLLAVSLRLAQPTGLPRAPWRLGRTIFFLTVLASAWQAHFFLAAIFGLWLFLRVLFLFTVVARNSTRVAIGHSLLLGMKWGVVVTFAIAVLQRYVLGYHEAYGTFGHQNGIGLMCNLVIMPTFALALRRGGSRLDLAVPLLGAVALILSLSRAGILLLLAGLALVFAFSLRRPTRRQWLIMAAGGVAAVTLFLRAGDQIYVRFTERSYGTFDAAVVDERALLEHAAQLMLRDHPLGVGANHFTHALHAQGYFAKVGLLARGAATDLIKVHNVYRLVGSELGYPGLLAFSLLLGTIIAVAFRHALGLRGSARGDLAFGAAVGMLVFAVQGLVEWIQITATMQYAFWTMAGVTAGVSGTSRSSSMNRKRT